MAGIRTALTELKTIQEALSITDPITETIQEAFTHPPGPNITPTAPFVINTWSFGEQRNHIAQEVHDYSINMQFFIYDADQDIAGDVCSAFHEAFLNSWRTGNNKDLNSGAVGVRIRGGEPTLVALTHNGITYAGLDLFLDCSIERT